MGQAATQRAGDSRGPRAYLESGESHLKLAKLTRQQINRRVLQGERIPHNEQAFSLFQPHTEWICKGKAGVPVGLGLRVCIMEDQYRFIQHHQVMEKTTGDHVAIVNPGRARNLGWCGSFRHP